MMADAATLRTDWQPPLLAPPLPGHGQVIAWTTFAKVIYALRRESRGLRVYQLAGEGAAWSEEKLH